MPSVSQADRAFGHSVLGIDWQQSKATVTGMVKEVNSKYAQFNGHLKFGFNQQLSSECYAVESPESFIPAQPSDGAVILRYCENDYPAGTAMSSTTHKAVVLGFPFETITDPSDRLKLMKQIMAFLTLQPRHLSAQDSIKVFAGTLIAPEEISLSSEAYTVNGMPLFMRDPAKLNEPETRRTRRRKS